MNFTCSVDINLNRNRVIELWKNPDNLKEWQDGYLRMERVSGEKGEAGAVTDLYYEMRGKPMVLRETVTVNNLPDSMEGYYVHEHTTNEMVVRFIELDENTTRYESDIHYTRLGPIMLRIIAKLFPGMFRKQSQKWMDQFKAFAERQA